MKIWIVDDEYYARKALSIIIVEALHQLGIRKVDVTEFASGEAVLGSAGLPTVDVIFTDIRMDELDGLSLCERLHGAYPHIRLVIITGYADFTYAQQAIKYNVQGYLTKPVDEREVHAVLERIVDGGGRLIGDEPEKGHTGRRTAGHPSRVPPGEPSAPDAFTVKLVEHYLGANNFQKACSLLEESFTQIPLGGWPDCLSLAKAVQRTILQSLASYPHTEEEAAGAAPALCETDSPAELCRKLCDAIQCLQVATERAKKNDLSLGEEARQYINRNFHENISLYDLAKNVFFVHPNYLSKVIKDATGQSFSKYLLQVRMENALKLIRQGDINIAMVAQLVGYNSESHFVQMFKRYYGYTPGTERRRTMSMDEQITCDR